MIPPLTITTYDNLGEHTMRLQYDGAYGFVALVILTGWSTRHQPKPPRPLSLLGWSRNYSKIELPIRHQDLEDAFVQALESFDFGHITSLLVSVHDTFLQGGHPDDVATTSNNN